MSDPTWQQEAAAQALERLLPRLRSALAAAQAADAAGYAAFEARLQREWPRLFTLLLRLYGGQYDFFYQLEQLLLLAGWAWSERRPALRALDAQREADPHWYQAQHVLGAVLYVDRFADTLAGLREHLPYLQRLGVTYLHLMPLFLAPTGNSDGGYAVSSYRVVQPELGTMEELAALADLLRANQISLVLDFVFNHTSDEHEWAKRARAGERTYEHFYLLFPDRTLPDQYDQTLREIFPTVRHGSFTWDAAMRRWVWTTFNSFQWDLNYANPEVFRAMGAELLFLANQGVEVLRLDAVAFIWKRMGSSCENQPEAHWIIQAYNALTRIVCPALLFKSEAIVHPDEVVKYLGLEEAQLSYNPLGMALCWEALATREVRLLSHALATRWSIPTGCAWINYLRVHDDIGWTFDDDDARSLGIDPWGHRRFLNAFYVGDHAASFARGVPFQANPATGDARVSGTLASLAGLEQALQRNDPTLIDLAVRRILLLFSVMLSSGGIPLLYVGDELATLNDYSYAHDPARADDSRWVHRATFDWRRAAYADDSTRPEGRVYQGLLRLIALRKQQTAFAGNELTVFEPGHASLLGYVRQHRGQRVLVLANFSEGTHGIAANRLRLYGLAYQFRDLISGQTVSAEGVVQLEGYQVLWLVGY
ncbi:amylosucrase [Candidatus Viridilinea mediisalina]|uniref:Amylosucrase n=1 Tax=Candidatus Viridilinea mediisalina TaxID=2024553 RepID=A0A2A6RJC0_9CHLR|nr:amylosucrase [Candidatus Viridilinea mediisalina]PDW02958.1 amylosucrase [Candidatus Viridilinea mediisalina]